ncbi:MAG: hypothetical protein QG671_785 [Actinomycetota bacterium]|nr:hypothetical protein [Actinomycetota bacterium]
MSISRSPGSVPAGSPGAGSSGRGAGVGGRPPARRVGTRAVINCSSRRRADVREGHARPSHHPAVHAAQTRTSSGTCPDASSERAGRQVPAGCASRWTHLGEIPRVRWTSKDRCRRIERTENQPGQRLQAPSTWADAAAHHGMVTRQPAGFRSSSSGHGIERLRTTLQALALQAFRLRRGRSWPASRRLSLLPGRAGSGRLRRCRPGVQDYGCRGSAAWPGGAAAARPATELAGAGGEGVR